MQIRKRKNPSPQTVAPVAKQELRNPGEGSRLMSRLQNLGSQIVERTTDGMDLGEDAEFRAVDQVPLQETIPPAGQKIEDNVLVFPKTSFHKIVFAN